ncbi:hypothetical protein SAMN02745181_3055 [Rubritalea squalenifaciens DSM 18772]|uniref:Uncharacterized protein n=2 Tax=Rubritalea TaxID=361050 RepID=A0A1M6P2I5_9BACT|nr:hypothetical protein SAMN02745181_3055 [Rubritalea squalenifaciens DSM 18772]
MTAMYVTVLIKCTFEFIHYLDGLSVSVFLGTIHMPAGKYRFAQAMCGGCF